MANARSRIECLREGSIIEPPHTPTTKTNNQLQTGVIGESPRDRELRRQRATSEYNQNAQAKVNFSTSPLRGSETSMSSMISAYGSISPAPSSASSIHENLTPHPYLLPHSLSFDYTISDPQITEAEFAEHSDNLVPNSFTVSEVQATLSKPSNTVIAHPAVHQVSVLPSANTRQNYCSKRCPCGGRTEISHAKGRTSGRLETMLNK